MFSKKHSCVWHLCFLLLCRCSKEQGILDRPSIYLHNIQSGWDISLSVQFLQKRNQGSIFISSHVPHLLPPEVFSFFNTFKGLMLLGERGWMVYGQVLSEAAPGFLLWGENFCGEGSLSLSNQESFFWIASFRCWMLCNSGLHSWLPMVQEL